MKKRGLVFLSAALILVFAGAMAAFIIKPGMIKRLANQHQETDYTSYTSTTMPEIYNEIVGKIDSFLLYSRNDAILPVLERRLQNDPDNLKLKFSVGIEHILYGSTDVGVKILEELEKTPRFMNDSGNKEKGKKETSWSVLDSLEQFIALGYLRMGEQNNCLMMHTDQSCVFPITGSGVHIDKSPVENAITRYLKIIEKNPEDYLAIWLLNVACQANGSVPPEVPIQLIIPPDRIPNEYDIKRFNDISVDLGVDNISDAGGIALDDFDNDGYIDIINGSSRLQGQIRYFHNNGDGTFSDFTERSKLMGAYEGLGMMQFDYNNDGWMDFLVTRGGWKAKAGLLPPSLYRNNANGTFTDVTVEAGLLHLAPSQTAEAADVDLDGDLDLFIGHEYNTESKLFLNNGNGTFNDVSEAAGLSFEGFVKGCSFGDYNNDGYPDLYVSDFGYPNRLYRNNGPGEDGQVTFTDVAETAGVQEPIWSFPCWFFDYNNDGWQDIYVSAYKPGYIINSCREFMGLPMDSTMFPQLYRNNGDGTFTNVAKETHIQYESFTMGCNYGDLDNDGYLDFYQSIGAPDYRAIFPNRMYRNYQGMYFQDCTVSGGFGQLQKGHAVGFCDFDFDGDQDVYTDIGGFFYGDVFQNSFFENPGHGNNWINVKFEGVKNNRFGVGCRVKLTFRENGSVRNTYFTIGKGASFGSNPIRLQAGVGPATVIDEVEITWPAGQSKQVFTNVPVNQFYLCKEDATNLSVLGVQAIQFRTMERMMAEGDSSMKHMHHSGM
jgi:hypothetical protein